MRLGHERLLQVIHLCTLKDNNACCRQHLYGLIVSIKAKNDDCIFRAAFDKGVHILNVDALLVEQIENMCKPAGFVWHFNSNDLRNLF